MLSKAAPRPTLCTCDAQLSTNIVHLLFYSSLSSSCVSCSPDESLAGPYSISCLACEDSSFKTAAMTTCENCPSEHTSAELRAIACTMCPAGTHCDVRFSAFDKIFKSGCFKFPIISMPLQKGAVLCAMCVLGTIAAPSSAECVSCSEGTFCSSIYMATCQECPRLSSSNEAQPTGCKRRSNGCPFNTFESTDGK